MADKTIDQLTLATAINDNDLFVLQQSNTAKKLLGSALKQYIAMVEVVSIESVTFDAQNRCVITLTDGTVATSISMKGQDGTNGADAPTITNIAIDAQYHLIVTLSNGTSYDAGYCRGASGTGIGDMLISEYDSDNAVKTAGGIADYVDDEISPISESVSSLSTQVANMAKNLGTKAHNARIWNASYTGNGEYDGLHPKTITFQFYPLIVFVMNGDFDHCYSHAPMTLIRGSVRARSEVMQALDETHYIHVYWNDKTVSWWSNENADYMNNTNGVQYYICAIGYDKDAEDAEES